MSKGTPMNKQKLKVLVACEFSGRVREAFRKRGHDAWSCDLLPSDDNSPYHIQGDVLGILDQGWNMVIAHPPCKYICNGGNNWLNRRPDLDWRGNRELGAEFFMKFIDAPCDKVAVENPIGCMSSKYRKPDQIIRPWMFGHEYNKDVCLWLKGLPKLEPTKIIDPPYKKLDFWSNKRNPNGRSLKSITFQGIADAMAEQWG
jgi:hypothetical protein